jgi:hypothetical protein
LVVSPLVLLPGFIGKLVSRGSRRPARVDMHP